MPDLSLQLAIAALTLLPFVLLYWVLRYVARRRLAQVFRTPRPWQLPTLKAWVERGWLDPELVDALPAELSPGTVFYEWARADPEAARDWRFREPLTVQTPVEALVRDAWDNLPEAAKRRTEERLSEAVRTAANWWGGAERGWNGRPLALLSSDVGRKQEALPLLPMGDLTAAPLPGPLKAEAVASDGDGPERVLALAVLRRATPRYTHPLAPKSSGTGSMLEGLSARVATDLGSRIGAGLGAALGPVGSMVGQYLGSMAGALGGKALSQPSLPREITAALGETETALARLGQLAETDDFARAAGQPARSVLEFGQQVEVVREGRSRRLRERVWPTPGLALVEEVLRVALAELQGYRTAAEVFVQTARKSPAPVAGGMVLQNPWLVRSLPGGVERLNAARSTLNRAAGIIRRGPPSA